MQFPNGGSTCGSIFFDINGYDIGILDSLHTVDAGDLYDNDDYVKYLSLIHKVYSSSFLAI